MEWLFGAAYLLIGVMLGVVELIAVSNESEGDTVTEIVRKIFVDRGLRTAGALLYLGFGVWFWFFHL